MNTLSKEQQATVEQHWEYAKSVSRKFGGRDDDLESLASLALCKAVLTHDASRSSIRTHVFRCVANAVIDEFRKRSRQRGITGFPLAEIGGPEVPPSPLDVLSGDMRRLALLRWELGMSARRISHWTGRPYSDVLTSLTEARRLIREAYRV